MAIFDFVRVAAEASRVPRPNHIDIVGRTQCVLNRPSELDVAADEVAVMRCEGSVLGMLGPGRHVLGDDRVPWLRAVSEGARVEWFFVQLGVIEMSVEGRTRRLRIIEPARLIRALELAGVFSGPLHSSLPPIRNFFGTCALWSEMGVRDEEDGSPTTSINADSVPPATVRIEVAAQERCTRCHARFVGGSAGGEMRKFCLECGAPCDARCGACASVVAANAKFCHRCGICLG